MAAFLTMIPSLIFSLATSPSALNNISTDVDEMILKKATARTELAVAYYSEKQYGQALKELDIAITTFPKYFPAHDMRGIINMELKRNDEAEKSFREALSIEPTNPDSNNNYGWFLCQTNRVQDSYSYFNKAYSDPSYMTPAKALYNAGRCALIEKDEAKAMKFFASALTADPKATIVLLEIGNMHLKNNRLDDVLNIVDQIIDIEGPSPQVLWLGLKAEQLKNNQSDVESYGLQLVKKFPKSPEAAMWKAKAF